MSETWVFPYLPFSDLRTMIFPINLTTGWCERKISSKSERFSIFGSSRFFIISSPFHPDGRLHVFFLDKRTNGQAQFPHLTPYLKAWGPHTLSKFWFWMALSACKISAPTDRTEPSYDPKRVFSCLKIEMLMYVYCFHRFSLLKMDSLWSKHIY